MTIHKEGYKSIAIATLIFASLNLLSFFFISAYSPLVSWIIFVLLLALLLFIISFFRLPARNMTYDDSLLICPADGKVVVIEEVFDEEYFKDKRLQVSIFMSPANVHVNRNPLSGDVIYSKYHKGKYLVAWHPKSSTENERHSVVIKKGTNEILVKQIAGAVAKRIVNYLQPGMQVKQNEELGFIKFGSRVDILLPIGSRVNVSLEQKVKGGVTVLASLL
ncbi:phosphatidylserine decarboxylase family protein [Flavihumibacter sp. ZG627]|uniref:phosphatidylserine decarboxylase family protein n=1 Tax=Flavihumibacter sp. ZG627 TaxID=1463156 RepID=UPI00057D0331|nr:phosphatidylserine decarboxylase family protein [Flavihumibacter sp. ZG627]KIC92169.1 phosphatidylserine decarboxylase [Flavihumibacter sp. ZG627]